MIEPAVKHTVKKKKKERERRSEQKMPSAPCLEISVASTTFYPA